MAAKAIKTLSKGKTGYFVVDDSSFDRNRSEKVGMLSKMFDHALKRFIKGYRMLTLGWTDGKTFIPIAQILLTAANEKLILNDTTKNLKEDETAFKNRSLSKLKGTDALIYLVKMALKSGIKANYILFDRWFTSPKLALELKKLGLDMIGMSKHSNVKYNYKNSKKNVKEIWEENKYRLENAPFYLCENAEIEKNGEKLSIKIVYLMNDNKKSDYLCLISTDTSLSREDIQRKYTNRWKIEVFFKICKQNLNLQREFRTLSYESMMAISSIVFARYIMLELLRVEKNFSISIPNLIHFIEESIKICQKSIFLSDFISFIHEQNFSLEFFALLEFMRKKFLNKLQVDFFTKWEV